MIRAKAVLLTVCSLLAVQGALAQAPQPRADLPEPVLQATHAGGVTVLVAAPVGGLIASGGRDGTVKIWLRRSGELLNTVAVSASWIRSLAFARDGRRLVVGAGDHVAYLYDALSGELLRRFEGANSAVTAVALSPDDSLLAVGTARDPVVQVWRLGGARYGSVRTREPSIRALGFASSDATLVIADRAGLSKWKVEAAGDARELSLAPGDPALLSAALRATDTRPAAVDGTGAVVADVDGVAIRWARLDEPSRHAPINASSLRALRFSPDDRILVTNSNRGDVAVWDLETGALASYLEDAAGSSAAFANGIALSEDGTTLTAVRGDSRSHWTWLLSSLTPLSLPPRTDVPNGFTVDYFPEWGADIGAPARPMPPMLGIVDNPEEFVTTRSALTKSGEIVVYAGFTTPTFLPYVMAESLSAGSRLWMYRGGAERRGRNISALAVSPDGSLVVVSLGDGALLWLDGVSGAVLRTDTAPRPTVLSVLEFSSDGALLAGAGSDGSIELWRRDGSAQPRPAEHGAAVLSLAFSADNRYLASGGNDNAIRIWDIETGARSLVLTGHSAAVTALRYAHEADVLISGSEDSTLRVWNPRAGQHLATAAAVPGGDWIAVSPQGFFDGTRRGWNALPFRFGSEPTKLYRPEQFFNQFFQPGLLGDVVRNGQSVTSLLQERNDARAELDIAALKASKLPAVSIRVRPSASGVRTVQLDVSVTDGGSGMRDLRIFRNQSLVEFFHGDLVGTRDAARFEQQVEIELTAGTNEISAYAFNRDDVKSEDAIVTVVGAASLRRPATAYILAIGVNEYANRDFDLKYASPDAELVAAALRESLERVGAYADIETVVLADAEATKDTILLALRRLAGVAGDAAVPSKLQALRRATPEDAVVVYFAGHGEASDGRYYLLPHDLGYGGRKDALTDADRAVIYDRSISDRELNDLLEQVDAGQLMLAMDACYSGQVLESAESRRGPLNARSMAQLAYEKGAYVLAASQSDTAAREVQRLGHGVLTYVLVERGLKAFLADSNQDGSVTVREWFRYAGVEVPRELRSPAPEIAAEQERRIRVGGRPLTVQRPQSYYRRDTADSWLIAQRAR